MTIEVAAHEHAQLFLDGPVVGSKAEKLRALASACVDLNETELPISWRKLTTPDWPSTVTVIRGSAVRNGVLYISTGGSANMDAQCWKRNGDGFIKHSHFGKKRMNCLLVDPVNNDLYMGLGSQHESGAAFVCKYDSNESYSQLGPNFAGQEIIYSMCWHGGQVHAGTFAEDTAGSARVSKWNGTAWVDVFAPGLDGLPASYSYAGAYTLFEFNGMLHVGMFSRTAGDAHVWRKTAGGWVNLGCPVSGSTYALANIEHNGKLVVCFSGDGSNGPVRSYNETTGLWEQVGNIPAEWAGATIFNHMAIDPHGRLLVGVGGVPGELSVWRLDDTWVKVAGGVNGSWNAPVGTGDEWIYRLQAMPDGKVIACIASSVPGAAGIWEMTDPNQPA